MGKTFYKKFHLIPPRNMSQLYKDDISMCKLKISYLLVVVDQRDEVCDRKYHQHTVFYLLTSNRLKLESPKPQLINRE